MGKAPEEDLLGKLRRWTDKAEGVFMDASKNPKRYTSHS